MVRILSALMVRYPILGWVSGFAGLIIFSIGLYHAIVIFHIQNAGLTAFSEAIRVVGHDSANIDVEYRFEVGGKSFIGQGEINFREKEKLHSGNRLAVKYLSDDPKQNALDAASYSSEVGHLLAGLVFLVLPFAIAKRRRRMRL